MKFFLQALAGIALMGGVAHAVLLDADLASARPGVVVAAEPTPPPASFYDRVVLGLMPVAAR